MNCNISYTGTTVHCNNHTTSASTTDKVNLAFQGVDGYFYLNVICLKDKANTNAAQIRFNLNKANAIQSISIIKNYGHLPFFRNIKLI